MGKIGQKKTDMSSTKISGHKSRMQGNHIVESTSANWQNHKPDILIHDNEKGKYILIDASLSGDRNMINKEAEKILKYNDLTIEVQRL